MLTRRPGMHPLSPSDVDAPPTHPRGVFEFPAPAGYRAIRSVDSAGQTVEEYLARVEACRAELAFRLMRETLDQLDPEPPPLHLL